MSTHSARSPSSSGGLHRKNTKSERKAQTTLVLAMALFALAAGTNLSANPLPEEKFSFTTYSSSSAGGDVAEEKDETRWAPKSKEEAETLHRVYQHMAENSDLQGSLGANPDDKALWLVYGYAIESGQIPDLAMLLPSDRVFTKAAQTTFIRANNGSPGNILCAVTTNDVRISGYELFTNGSVSCGTTVESIELIVGVYRKTTSSSASNLYHSTNGGKKTNVSSRTLQNYALCPRRATNWWGGNTVFRVTFKPGWTVLTGSGYTVSGRSASGSRAGSFQPFANCGQ